MNVIGLDLSLTATGVAVEGRTQTIREKLEANASELQRVLRLHRLSCRIDRVCRAAELVVIEGYGFNAKHSPGHSLGELGGVVKVCLLQRGIPFVIVPPNKLKQFATGKGNAPKDAVFAAAIRDGAPVDDNNAADAYWLRAMALAHYRDTASNQVRKQVLGSILWPQLERKEVASAEAV